MRALVVMALLLLAGCGESVGDRQRNEATRDIARAAEDSADRAIERIEDHEQRIKALQIAMSAIEQRRMPTP